VDPSLRVSEILDTVVGLRPARFEVRLEKELNTWPKPVIHNYGHGGAGFTLSWGCAEEVLKQVKSLVPC
jgi:D-amino-acid oxidase